MFSCRIILIANVFYFYKVILPNDSIKLMLRCSIEEDLPHPPADIWKYLEIFLVPPAGRGQATAPRGGADTAKCPNTHGIGPHNRNCLSQMSILLKLGNSVNLGSPFWRILESPRRALPHAAAPEALQDPIREAASETFHVDETRSPVNVLLLEPAPWSPGAFGP